MEVIDTKYGVSPETESNWNDCLSSAHRQFVLAYLQAAQAREAAVIEEFLKSR